MEDRIRTRSCNSHRARISHTCHTAAAPTLSLSMHPIHATTRHQHRNCETSFVMHALLTQDDQYTAFPLCTETENSYTPQRTIAPSAVHPLSAAIS